MAPWWWNLCVFKHKCWFWLPCFQTVSSLGKSKMLQAKATIGLLVSDWLNESWLSSPICSAYDFVAPLTTVSTRDSLKSDTASKAVAFTNNKNVTELDTLQSIYVISKFSEINISAHLHTRMGMSWRECSSIRISVGWLQRKHFCVVQTFIHYLTWKP